MENNHTKETMQEKPEPGESCAIGGCGGPGLCPGIALLLAYAAGTGIHFLTGLVWLGWLVGSALAIILISGVWRFIPHKGKS